MKHPFEVDGWGLRENQVEILNWIDKQPPWQLTREWVEERMQLTKEYLAGYGRHAPNRGPSTLIPCNQLLALLEIAKAAIK